MRIQDDNQRTIFYSYSLKHLLQMFIRIASSAPTTYVFLCINEPRYDKTNKVTVHPAKTLIRVFAVRSMSSWGPKVSSCGQQRLWSDWADAKADPSLRWVHSHYGGFVMLWLKCGTLSLNYNQVPTLSVFLKVLINGWLTSRKGFLPTNCEELATDCCSSVWFGTWLVSVNSSSLKRSYPG